MALMHKGRELAQVWIGGRAAAGVGGGEVVLRERHMEV